MARESMCPFYDVQTGECRVFRGLIENGANLPNSLCDGPSKRDEPNVVMCETEALGVVFEVEQNPVKVA